MPSITQDAAISIARHRIKLMRQSDVALRAGNIAEAHRLDRKAQEDEHFLHAHGFGNLAV